MRSSLFGVPNLRRIRVPRTSTHFGTKKPFLWNCWDINISGKCLDAGCGFAVTTGRQGPMANVNFWFGRAFSCHGTDRVSF